MTALAFACLLLAPPSPAAPDRVESAPPAATEASRHAVAGDASPATVARAMRGALASSLRWHGCGDAAIAQLGVVVESLVLAADPARLPESKRRRAEADFAAWLGSPDWRPPQRRASGTVEAEDLAAAESTLRWALGRWLEAPPVGDDDRVECIAEEQAMLAATLEAIETIASARRLDDQSTTRLRRRVLEQSEIRLARRGNPFFPEWAPPRTLGASALGDSLSTAIAQDALLRAITERAAIELEALERDPRTARFRRLLVESQIDAAANRLEELVSRVLDTSAPHPPPRALPPPPPHRAASETFDEPPPVDTADPFERFIESLLAEAPAHGSP